MVEEKEEKKGEEKEEFTVKSVYKCLTGVQGALKMIEDACEGLVDEETLKATFGLAEEEEINDLSAYCVAILKSEWLTKERCYDFRDIRRYVMCLAWKKMEEERLAFRDAIRGAWAEAKEKCRTLGAVI